jgi:2-C-methyl-D-erythritol 4-phosphate cytidylyltransferase/2-C-methyl-D-erythritol 2,4-cyclodiphosphate synthase
MGGDVPKQWLPLDGRPMLRHSLGTFAGHAAIDAVRVVIHPDDRARYDAAAAGLSLGEPMTGGPTRQDSVRLGLEALTALNPEYVLIHDGARPFVDQGLISRVIAALSHAPGAVPALPVVDTLKRGDDERIVGTVPRDNLYRAQTPQGFHFAPLLAAHRAAVGHPVTDDAAVAELAGLNVVLVPGSEDNVKITTTNDLARAAARYAAATPEFRVGNGYDVHRFGPGTHVMLCNVPIPHEAGLEGHSDADVALHAITDALLGAVSAGDIGRIFSPADARWKGADSAIFLAHAGALVEAMGGTILHIDVTVICERPKVGPHRAAMVARVAAILGLSPDRVSVKATTTEGLGFTGRAEGIAAQATATISLRR